MLGKTARNNSVPTMSPNVLGNSAYQQCHPISNETLRTNNITRCMEKQRVPTMSPNILWNIAYQQCHPISYETSRTNNVTRCMEKQRVPTMSPNILWNIAYQQCHPISGETPRTNNVTQYLRKHLVPTMSPDLQIFGLPFFLVTDCVYVTACVYHMKQRWMWVGKNITLSHDVGEIYVSHCLLCGMLLYK